MKDLGLALSGGGSRAAAFHRGTLRALGELGLTDRVKAISSVSGGSVFAAAWMAARARKQSDAELLDWSHRWLQRGFIRPALLHPRALKIALPGYTRTHLLAATFDALLFRGLDWSDLPREPRLCLNTAVLNNASSGRFSQTGYSGAGVGALVDDGDGGKHYQEDFVSGATIGFATAASAAFPFGLPPLRVAAKRFKFPLHELPGHPALVLTDGGIIENLGAERLLKRGRFACKHIIVSDAGVRDTPWRPTLLGRIKSAAIFSLSAQTLDRLLVVMNDKQNRSMRELVFAQLVAEPRDPSRCFLIVRVNQSWSRMVRGVPSWRLVELGVDPEDPAREAALDKAVGLSRAREVYRQIGDEGARRANEVSTSFVGLDAKTLDVLEAHARWQVLFAATVYGPHLLDDDSLRQAG